MGQFSAKHAYLCLTIRSKYDKIAVILISMLTISKIEGSIGMSSTFQDSTHGIFIQIMRLEGAILHKLADNFDLYPGQFHLLMFLQENNGSSQKAIADISCVSKPTITVTLNGMEQQGLVKKEKDSHDRRITRIYLTAKGREIAQNISAMHDKLNQEFLRNFSREEQLLLRRFLLQIRNNLIDIKDKDIIKL
jgi:DNA-binding MarR family transcriptional regulator